MLALRRHIYLAALGVLTLLATAAGAETYTGMLTTDDGGLVGTDPWATGPSTLSWTVEAVEGPIWQYCYTLTVPEKAVSHFILELSDDFGPEKLESPSLWINGCEVAWADVDTEFGLLGPGNPSIPDVMYGIKVDIPVPPPGAGDDPLTVTFCFRTLRDPVWGDFYAKDGTAPGAGAFVTLWNAGFTDPDTDPIDFPADGALEGHLLVPDDTEIPEPMTLAMLATGGMFALVLRRKR